MSIRWLRIVSIVGMLAIFLAFSHCGSQNGDSASETDAGGDVELTEERPAPSEQEDPPFPAPETVKRYPTVNAPRETRAGQEFAVMFSLTRELQTPEVRVIEGDSAKSGEQTLEVPLEKPLDVMVVAPGFRFRNGRNSGRVTVSREGDSSPAIFHLTADPISENRLKRPLYFTLWHNGGYLGKAMREIAVVNPAAAPESPETVSEADSLETVTSSDSQPIVIKDDPDIPDLTLLVSRKPGDSPAAPIQYTLYLQSHGMQPTKGDFSIPANFAELLRRQFGKFARRSARNVEVIDPDASASTQMAGDVAVAEARGFGKQLFNKYAPPLFKEAFWNLSARLDDKFQFIQIISDDPLIPWELMIPQKPGQSGREEFLGISHNIGRWHLSTENAHLDYPPARVAVDSLLVIAPDYQGHLQLPHLKQELASLETVSGFRRLPGEFSTVKILFSELPSGIIHFAGHGKATASDSPFLQYAIHLEDIDLDLMTWRGLISNRQQHHPFVFFNACEVGQAEGVGNFVDGWAPAVLETGASGFVGGLWPLGDRGAAEFAADFYGRLEEQLQQSGEANVTEVLRDTRKEFYEKHDPTFLAYVFYGDPYLKFTRSGKPE